jgi:hypothetical protein
MLLPLSTLLRVKARRTSGRVSVIQTPRMRLLVLDTYLSVSPTSMLFRAFRIPTRASPANSFAIFS